jgi:hypothetical protein
MKTWTVVFAITAVAPVAQTAFADQCVMVEVNVANRAATELRRHSVAIAMCEPCGDAAPAMPRRVREVTVRRADGSSHEVVVDGEPIDRAYTYVPAQDGYRNLAAIAGCEASDVSPSLAVNQATSTGLLIVADPRLDARDVPTASPLPPAPPTAAAATPPAVNVQVETVVPPAWIAIAIAGSASTAAAILLLGSAAIRRRRTMIPRAMLLDPDHPPRAPRR